MSETRDLRRAIEALIFASDEPATAAYLRRALPSLAVARLPDLVEEINEDLRKAERPYEVVRVAGGYQFRTLPEFAETILAAQPQRKLRLSRAALETLAVIAYRQPFTRAEVEELRSVDCGAVLKSLLERSLIRIVGRRDAPGRPVLYGTSSQFLETFGLAALRDLPALREIDALGDEQAGTPAEEATAGQTELELAEEGADASDESEESEESDAPEDGADELAADVRDLEPGDEPIVEELDDPEAELELVGYDGPVDGPASFAPPRDDPEPPEEDVADTAAAKRREPPDTEAASG